MVAGVHPHLPSFRSFLDMVMSWNTVEEGIYIQFVESQWYFFDVMNVQQKLENSNVKFSRSAYL